MPSLLINPLLEFGCAIGADHNFLIRLRLQHDLDPSFEIWMDLTDRIERYDELPVSPEESHGIEKVDQLVERLIHWEFLVVDVIFNLGSTILLIILLERTNKAFFKRHFKVLN